MMSTDAEALILKSQTLTHDSDSRAYQGNAQQQLSSNQSQAAARDVAASVSSMGPNHVPYLGSGHASSAGAAPPASRWAKNREEEFCVYNEKVTPVILRVSLMHAWQLLRQTMQGLRS
jgi:hypothetical protein